MQACYAHVRPNPLGIAAASAFAGPAVSPWPVARASAKPVRASSVCQYRAVSWRLNCTGSSLGWKRPASDCCPGGRPPRYSMTFFQPDRCAHAVMDAGFVMRSEAACQAIRLRNQGCRSRSAGTRCDTEAVGAYTQAYPAALIRDTNSDSSLLTSVASPPPP